jgi:hypothetical protein
MHPCSETPSLKGKDDEGCLELLNSTFSFIYRIGDKETVSASLVFKLSQQAQDVAVKVIPLREEDDLKDIKIACLLNGLLEESPIFVRTFGWLKCKEIPPLWTKGMDTKKSVPKSFLPYFKGNKKASFVFQVMSFSSHSWTDERIRLDLEEYRVMLFLLMHGLWLAKIRYGFKHNDIHQGQVLFQTCKPNTPITVSVAENNYTLVCQRFVPKLIDFGLSTTSSSSYSSYSSSEEYSKSDDDSMFDKGEEIEDDDLRNLFYMFEQRMEKDGLKPFVPQKGNNTLEDILVKDALFKSIRNNNNSTSIKNSVGFICDVCSSVATHEWEHKGIRFCGDACASQWSDISKIL